MGNVDDMTFQFWTNKAPLDRRDGVVPTGMNESALIPHGPAQKPTPNCNVEQACAAFLKSQDAIVALTVGRDEDLNVNGLSELTERRQEAFRQVRSHAAQRSSAYQAKLRVLNVMRDWFAVEDPEVSAFAIELANEAAALLENDRNRACMCHREAGEAFDPQSQGAERRNPFGWFSRSLAKASEAPFAS